MNKKGEYAWVLTNDKNNVPKQPKQRKPSSKSAGPEKNPSIVYELEVTLQYIKPRIWRLFTVPSSISLEQLHEALLAVMGWVGGHLWEFDVQGVHYADPVAVGDASVQAADNVHLSDVISRRGSTFEYIYDWGDEWRHKIKVKNIRALQTGESVPALLDGACACPPEDVGGVPGYAMFLEAINDPNHPEHEELLEWVGGDFDPDEFDRKAHQRSLASAAKRGKWAVP